MSAGHRVVLETERLLIRTATEDDADLFNALWTDPQVMKNVGFPRGLPVTHDELKITLSGQSGSEFDRLLVVQLKLGLQSIGECKLSLPDENGIAEPDVKLLPQYWGQEYGVEVWRAIADYQFAHTECCFIQATPNVDNIASIKMQEAVGSVRTGEAVHRFPEHMQSYTTPVHHYVYRLNRADWQRKQAG